MWDSVRVCVCLLCIDQFSKENYNVSQCKSESNFVLQKSQKIRKRLVISHQCKYACTDCLEFFAVVVVFIWSVVIFVLLVQGAYFGLAFHEQNPRTYYNI